MGDGCRGCRAGRARGHGLGGCQAGAGRATVRACHAPPRPPPLHHHPAPPGAGPGRGRGCRAAAGPAAVGRQPADRRPAGPARPAGGAAGPIEHGGAVAGAALAPGGAGAGTRRERPAARPGPCGHAVLPGGPAWRRRSPVQPGLDADQRPRHRARRRPGGAPVPGSGRAGHAAGAEDGAVDGHAAWRATALPAADGGAAASTQGTAGAAGRPPAAPAGAAAAAAARDAAAQRAGADRQLRQAGGARLQAQPAAGAGHHQHREQLQPECGVAQERTGADAADPGHRGALQGAQHPRSGAEHPRRHGLPALADGLLPGQRGAGGRGLQRR